AGVSLAFWAGVLAGLLGSLRLALVGHRLVRGVDGSTVGCVLRGHVAVLTISLRSRRSAEQREDGLGEHPVQRPHQRHHEGDEGEHDRGVGDHLLPGWPDDLAQLRDDLPQEAGDPPEDRLLLAGVLPLGCRGRGALALGGRRGGRTTTGLACTAGGGLLDRIAGSPPAGTPTRGGLRPARTPRVLAVALRAVVAHARTP